MARSVRANPAFARPALVVDIDHRRSCLVALPLSVCKYNRFNNIKRLLFLSIILVIYRAKNIAHAQRQESTTITNRRGRRTETTATATGHQKKRENGTRNERGEQHQN
jgi:hypothetical protein